MITYFELYNHNDLHFVSLDQNYGGSFTVKDGGTGKVSFDLKIKSTHGVEIEIMCFKSIPAPPCFRPCPEAGTINLPRRFAREDNAHFSLSVYDQAASSPFTNSTYALFAFDYESFYNIHIHIIS